MHRRGYTEDDAKSSLTEIGDYLDQAEAEAESEHPDRERLAALMDRVALVASHPAVAFPVLIAFPEVSVWVEGALVAWRLWREGGDTSQVDYA